MASDLPGHDVSSVPKIGWAGVKNGELLVRAAGRFDVLVTMDLGFGARTPIPKEVSVVILRARSNRLDDTRPLMPTLLSIVDTIQRGIIITISE